MSLFDFFKKKPASPPAEDQPLMADLNQTPLREGDLVQVFRYELGTCRIIAGVNGPEYESVETGERVGWLRMVDAATKLQKVKKIA